MPQPTGPAWIVGQLDGPSRPSPGASPPPPPSTRWCRTARVLEPRRPRRLGQQRGPAPGRYRPPHPDPPDGGISAIATGAAAAPSRRARPTSPSDWYHRSPPPDREGDAGAQRYLLSLGITSWQDAWLGPPGDAAYRLLAGRGELKARVVGCLWWDRHRGLDQVDELIAWGSRRGRAVPAHREDDARRRVRELHRPHARALPPTPPAPPPTTSGCCSSIPRWWSPGVGRSMPPASRSTSMPSATGRCGRARCGLRSGRGSQRPRQLSPPHHLAHLQLVHPDDQAAPPGWGRGRWPTPSRCGRARHDGYQDDLTIPLSGDGACRPPVPVAEALDAGARLAPRLRLGRVDPDPFQILHVAVDRIHPEAVESVLLPRRADHLAEGRNRGVHPRRPTNRREHDTGSLAPGKLAGRAAGRPGRPGGGRPRYSPRARTAPGSISP